MTFATRTLVLFSLINLVNYIDRFVVAAILEPLGKDLGLDDAQRGRLTFVFVIVYMLAAPVFGALADRFHRPRLIAAGVAIWSLATMAAAFVQDFTMLLVARSFVGIGEAAYASLGPAVLSDCIPESQRARRFTWFYLAIPVGSALGYAIGGVVAQHYGWRAAFLVAGVPGLILAGLMLRLEDPERGALDAVKEEVQLRQHLRARGCGLSQPRLGRLHRELRRLHVRDGRAVDLGTDPVAAPLSRGDRRGGRDLRRHRRGDGHPRHVHRRLRDRPRTEALPESGRDLQRDRPCCSRRRSCSSRCGRRASRPPTRCSSARCCCCSSTRAQ